MLTEVKKLQYLSYKVFGALQAVQDFNTMRERDGQISINICCAGHFLALGGAAGLRPGYFTDKT